MIDLTMVRRRAIASGAAMLLATAGVLSAQDAGRYRDFNYGAERRRGGG
jgi:hypothetical protein